MFQKRERQRAADAERIALAAANRAAQLTPSSPVCASYTSPAHAYSPASPDSPAPPPVMYVPAPSASPEVSTLVEKNYARAVNWHAAMPELRHQTLLRASRPALAQGCSPEERWQARLDAVRLEGCPLCTGECTQVITHQQVGSASVAS